MIATFSIPLSGSCVELPRSSRIPSVITWWTSYKKDLKQCVLPPTLPQDLLTLTFDLLILQQLIKITIYVFLPAYGVYQLLFQVIKS